MPRHEEPARLCVAGNDAFGREVWLTPAAVDAWHAMRAAAGASGVTLRLISGFRSKERQTEIVRRKLESGIPLDRILAVNAYPGFSEHHTGRAVDLGSPHSAHLSEAFATTPEFSWLERHAAQFGFHLSYPRGNHHGIAYEPWHWCWSAQAAG